jgi:DNA repair protein RecO (recombination protein O)
MLKRTEGVVLKSFPFGEADLIVTYLTPDFGITKVFAKSPRKMKSRFGSSLEPLTHSNISFWGKDDSALPRLTQSDIMRPFQSLREDLGCFLKISEIIELTLRCIPERDANKSAYLLLLNTLSVIEKSLSGPPGDGKGINDRGSLFVSHYKIRFLELAGFAPRLDACGKCGKTGTFFYLSHGSVLCESCAGGMESPIRIPPAVLQLYTHLLTWDTVKIDRIKPSVVLLSELSELINMHINYVLSRPLKSQSFIQSLPA